jgi:glycosyltransferase involved in cell wall biosynthesis
MRIAYLCKRHYMSKDVILDRYARLYEIPRQLALLGHDVEAFCFAYSPTLADVDVDVEHDASPGRLRWRSRNAGRAVAPRMAAYPRRLLGQLRGFDPDIVIAASDIPHVALGAWLARKLQRPFVADLYDNFEGFGQARIPGMVGALRRAVRRADLVVTTSEPLRELVVEGYGARGEVVAMPSSVDKAVFRPGDKLAAREALGLPLDALLVGTAGGLYRDKGIGVLYAAWEILAKRRTDVHLVLAGPHEAVLPPPSGARVHALGALPHERVADLFRALDVGAICVLDTSFGRYCFPQKAYEMLACGLPVAAPDLGALGSLLAPWRDHCLHAANDPEALADRIEAQLVDRFVPPVPIEGWDELIARIEPRLPRR